MNWILVIYVYAGVYAKGDSVAITYIPHFKSEAACAAAGNVTKSLVNGSIKEHRFVCIRQE
jgi:hypothetical protein